MLVIPDQVGRDQALLVRCSGSVGIKVSDEKKCSDISMGGFTPLPSEHMPITEPLWLSIPPSHMNLKNHDTTS